MTKTITVQSLGTTVESVNVQTVNRALLNYVADLSDPSELLASGQYKLQSGLPQYAPEVVTSIRSDKPTKKGPLQDHYTTRLSAVVTETDDTTGLVEAEGPVSCIIALNWTKDVPFSLTEGQQIIMNTFALWYGSVAGGAPSTDKLEAFSFGRAFIYPIN